MKRRILVTGAAGEMGSRLIRRLLHDEWMVRGLVLPGDPLRARLAGLECEIVEGDIRHPDSLAPAVHGIDTVLHAAAVILSTDPRVLDGINRVGTAHMVSAAAKAGVRHFVYISSASVTYPRLTPYGQSKLAAESLVRDERRFAHTIVRPTLVYDRTGGEEFMMFLNLLRRYPVVPFIGSGAARKSPVRAEDVVDGLAKIAGNPSAFGQTYNLSGGESITLEELGRLLLQLHGETKPFVHVPVWLCRALAAASTLCFSKPPLTQYGVTGFINHADLDCTSATTDLGYHPVGARAGLRLCFSGAATRATAAGDPTALTPSIAQTEARPTGEQHET